MPTVRKVFVTVLAHNINATHNLIKQESVGNNIDFICLPRTIMSKRDLVVAHVNLAEKAKERRRDVEVRV